MALSALTPAQILGRIRYDPLSKKGSVLDVVQLVTNCGRAHASETFSGVVEKFPDVNDKIGNFKFPGQGQRLTPVAHLATLIEIAWLCPGKHAKEFRRTGAVTLCRALGGDLSLVDEIRERHAEVAEGEQEALLAGTGVTVAEANGQALVPTYDQARYTAETDMLVARVKAAVLANYERMMELSRTGEDERDRLFFIDAARNYIRTNLPLAAGNQLEASGSSSEPITISGVAEAMGVRLRRGDESGIGRVLARLYRQRHGKDPPKHKQYVDGAVRAVNSYFEKDRALVEEAVREVKQG